MSSPGGDHGVGRSGGDNQSTLSQSAFVNKRNQVSDFGQTSTMTNQTSDLPRPDSGHSPQGWLLRQVLPPSLAAEGALPFPSSEGAAERRCLDLHSPFERD